MNYYNSLINKINKKSAKIGIIGLGYVGLPLALQFSKKKFNVIGFDIDLKKINNLKRNKSYINHIPSKLIKINKKKLFFTSSYLSCIFVLSRNLIPLESIVLVKINAVLLLSINKIFLYL